MLSIEVSAWLSDVTGGVYTIKEITGRANSKIFKIITKDQNYALKLYPSKEFDKRERLLVEFDALTILHQYGVSNTPRPIRKSTDLNTALYEWIDGVSLREVGLKEVSDALNFIDILKKISSLKSDISSQLASEACLSAKELVSQIDRRFKRLSEIDIKEDPELHKFLSGQFKPVFDEVKKKINKNWKLPWLYDKDLIKEFQTLSPSDFGFHNAIYVNNNKIIYIDFEYFGWDDPVKLTSDFIWHAGMDITNKAQHKWLEGMCGIFVDDKYFLDRFQAYHPLYGLRWSMILLNEFLPEVWEIRKHANRKKEKNHKSIKQIQLNKSKKYLLKVKGLMHELN
ncbi:aminoglycoside phosphotransferase family protein [bacterium]|nr:aminoglycoside phosphotransferase family protein [bacterium]